MHPHSQLEWSSYSCFLREKLAPLQDLEHSTLCSKPGAAHQQAIMPASTRPALVQGWDITRPWHPRSGVSQKEQQQQQQEQLGQQAQDSQPQQQEPAPPPP